MNKPRLAVFNTQPPHIYTGGVERRIIETAKRLQTELDIAVYSGTKAGFKTPQTVDGIKLFPVKSTDKIFPIDNWTFNRNLTAKASSIEAEIYEAHAASAYGIPKKLRQISSKKPFVHVVHGVLADEYVQAKAAGYSSFREKAANMLMAGLAKHEGEMARRANVVVTISNYSLRELVKHYGVSEDKVRIVPNGVDTDTFKPQDKTEELMQSFNLKLRPTVLFVGNLIPRKGPMYFVSAAKKIIQQQPNTQFVVVGEGPLKPNLIQATQTAGLSENFTFLGKLSQTQLPKIYACADVFVLPSIQEGQGIVLLEAQACGKPVVAFNCGGVSEAMQNNKSGVLVEALNVDDLADALTTLLADESLRVKMGRTGRMFVLDGFTWGKCASGMLKVYRDALNST